MHEAASQETVIRRLFDVTETEKTWQSAREGAQLSKRKQIVEAFYHLTRCTQPQPRASDTRAGQQLTTTSRSTPYHRFVMPVSAGLVLSQI